MSTVSRATAEHYTWGQDCDGWHLLKGADLSVIEERMPPDSEETRHLHSRSRQFFYVLAGEAELELDGRPHRLTAGHGLHVPPGLAHQMRNRSDTEVRFLVVSSPQSHGDRITGPINPADGSPQA